MIQQESIKNGTDEMTLEEINIEKEGKYKITIPQNIRFDDEDNKIFYEWYKNGDVDYLITGNIKHFPNEL